MLPSRRDLPVDAHWQRRIAQGRRAGTLYIDPGTGSLVIQAIIAALISVPLIFRDAIRKAIRRVTGPRDGDGPEVEPGA